MFTLMRRQRSRRDQNGQGVQCRPHLERLEDRCVPTVTLAQVDALNTLQGSDLINPPDSQAAAGSNSVIETVNARIQIRDRPNLGLVIFTENLAPFFNVFAPPPPAPPPVRQPDVLFFDPRVSYDSLDQRFVVTVLQRLEDASGTTVGTRFFFARSRDNPATTTINEATNPRGHNDFDRVSFDVTDSVTQPPNVYLADFDNLGWNKDGYVISMNMFKRDFMKPNSFGDFNGTRIAAIRKSDLAPFFNDTLRSQGGGITPVHMLDSGPGDPMWYFQATYPGQPGPQNTTMRVFRHDSLFTIDSNIASFVVSGVVAYERANPSYQVPQPNNAPLLNGGDERFGSSPAAISFQNPRSRDPRELSWRFFAAHTVFEGGTVHARWYEVQSVGKTVDVVPATAITQQVNITPGPGIFTYYPSIEFAANYNIYLTYMRSSVTEAVGVYAAGHRNGEPNSTLQDNISVRLGNDVITNTNRLGDYSSAARDPNNRTSVWIANEYATPVGTLHAGGTVVAQIAAADNRTLARQFYRDILGRADSGISAMELADRTRDLDNALLSPGSMAQNFVTSSEWQQKTIKDYFQRYLNRAATTADINAWMPAFAANPPVRVEQFRAAILGSQEYFNLNGQNNDVFLADVYQDVLNRAIDAAGSTYWRGQLNSGVSRTQVAQMIVQSTEGYTVLVRELYMSILHRSTEQINADPNGLNYFVSLLQNGQRTHQGVIVDMAGSLEFQNYVARQPPAP